MDYLIHLGVQVSWVTVNDVQAYKAAVKQNTKVFKCVCVCVYKALSMHCMNSGSDGHEVLQ